MPKPKRPVVIVPPAPTSPGPMPHADSPKVLADSAEFRPDVARPWRCPHDGQMNTNKRCTTCGTEKA